MADDLDDDNVRWMKANDYIDHALRIALRDNSKLGAAVTYVEGEKWVRELSSKISYDVHRIIDPQYDA